MFKLYYTLYNIVYMYIYIIYLQNIVQHVKLGKNIKLLNTIIVKKIKKGCKEI